MNILAVIPARAGSKGIPNKNIRIIGEHPLIYYSIKNATESKLITDIIISTDSPEVRIIAKQMGVICHWRDASLCGDAVTLDAVIFDAIPKDKKWDYVVSMQPTSPTLTVPTLDAAIQYTIDNSYDTVVAVTNSPHLSWRIKGSKVVPNYVARLNRQYLPPHYKETGAFFISKASVITEKTRFGQAVSVFEIPESEAQDVDTFADLHNVAISLNKHKVAIYVNGNNDRGMGHIYRALEISDEFYCKPDIYYDSNQTNPQMFGKTMHKLLPVNGIAELFDKCKNENYDIFINDILNTSIDYMIALRAAMPNAKIINFEDDGEGAIKADLVFNALFKKEELPRIYAGEKYYISGKTFMFYEPINVKEHVERVFISFGGADPQNYSDRLLTMITNPHYQKYQFVVALGRAKYNVDALMEYNKYLNIEVFYDVSNMPEIMTSCDIGITSRGRTAYELAMLGIPTIAMAQNQREEKHSFVCNENGFTYIGLNPADEIIEANLKMYLGLSKLIRQQFQNKLLSHDLRNGRKRVMGLINSL
jgi:CMP-N-acetylneuraminic acid synthetase/spore coat polysaccharide biosynthesis predicted glycosyltransferase SpsG